MTDASLPEKRSSSRKPFLPAHSADAPGISTRSSNVHELISMYVPRPRQKKERRIRRFASHRLHPQHHSLFQPPFVRHLAAHSLFGESAVGTSHYPACGFSELRGWSNCLVLSHGFVLVWNGRRMTRRPLRPRRDGPKQIHICSQRGHIERACPSRVEEKLTSARRCFGTA